MSGTDLLVSIASFVLDIIFFNIFLESWKQTIVDDYKISSKTFFLKKEIYWKDIDKVAEGKTNQFFHFAQGKLLFLYSKKDRIRIEINTKVVNYSELEKIIKEKVPEAYTR